MSTETKQYAENYYAANFPRSLFVHKRPGFVVVSTSDNPTDCSSEIAEFEAGTNAAEFAEELIRRWNHSPQREQALMDVKAMAGKRRTQIRMPNGMMLDTFCGVALLEGGDK